MGFCIAVEVDYVNIPPSVTPVCPEAVRDFPVTVCLSSQPACSVQLLN